MRAMVSDSRNNRSAVASPMSGGEALRLEVESRLAIPLRGALEAEASLARHTWFRTGGAAELLFTPASEEDLANFLRALPVEAPLTILGLGSNVLVRDGGVRGAVVRLARPFNWVRVSGDEPILEAGGGTPDIHLAREAQKAGLAGLEFFAGIPGSLGGALRMNAGAFGGETREVLLSARALLRNGETREYPASALGLSYRHSTASQELIYLSAKLVAHHGDKEAIAEKIETIRTTRGEAQPSGIATGGSTFKNPSGKSSDGTTGAQENPDSPDSPDSMSAWQLIESVGGRGLRVGQAEVSEKHCNFLVNRGGASSLDIERLGEELRRRVFAQHGIQLEWEIQRLGDFLPNETLDQEAGGQANA